MGYAFSVVSAFRVKADKVYPWPCEALPDRVYEIFTEDVLTRHSDGTYMKHTGLGTFGHVIPAADLEPIPGDVHLRII